MLFWSIAKIVGGIISAGLVCVGLYFSWVRLCLQATANQAKLKAKAFIRPPLGIDIKIENVGSKKVFITHIELCRVKCRGVGLCGFKYEYGPDDAIYKTVESNKEHKNYPREFILQEVPALMHPDDLDELESGETCIRRVSRIPAKGMHNELAKIAASKKEVKAVRFVVCADSHGKFPVKSKKSVISEIFEGAKKEQNATHQLENNENPFS